MENTTNFEDLLIEKYGVKGTEKRDKLMNHDKSKKLTELA